MSDHEVRELCTCDWLKHVLLHDVYPICQLGDDHKIYLQGGTVQTPVLEAIAYCPHCGGKLPVGQKLVDNYDPQEHEELRELLSTLTTMESVNSILGPPDQIRTRSFPTREHLYENKWRTISLCICEVNDGTIKPFYYRKPNTTKT